MKIEALEEVSEESLKYPPIRSLAIEQFAKDNNFNYSPSDDAQIHLILTGIAYDQFPAWLDYGKLQGVEEDRKTFHVVTGNYLGYDFRMFMMQNIVAYKGLIVKGVVRVKLPVVFPQVVLDSNKNDKFLSSMMGFSEAQRIQLEGDFNKYYDLFAPKGLQVNVLSLLAPNMMQILKDSAGLFDVEFYGNELVLATRQPLYLTYTMKILDAALTEQLTYLTRLAQSWSYVPNKQPFDMLEKSFVSGGPQLKLGRFRIPGHVQLLIILLTFFVPNIIFSILSYFKIEVQAWVVGAAFAPFLVVVLIAFLLATARAKTIK